MCALPDKKAKGYDGHDVEKEEYEEQENITFRPHVSELQMETIIFNGTLYCTLHNIRDQ